MSTNSKPRSPRTIARQTAKQTRLDVQPVTADEVASVVPTFTTIPTMGEVSTPPDPMAGWGSIDGGPEGTSLETADGPLESGPTEAESSTTGVLPTYQEAFPMPPVIQTAENNAFLRRVLIFDKSAYSHAMSLLNDDGEMAARAWLQANYNGLHDLLAHSPVAPSADMTEAQILWEINASINPPIIDRTPITLADVYGCESELIFSAIPSPSRTTERQTFLKGLKLALDKVSQGGSIASTGVKDVEKGIDLDREIRLMWGPIGGRTYDQPFNGFPTPEEFIVRTATLQSGPPKATSDKPARTLKSTKTQKPTAWGQRQLLGMEKLGPTDGLRAPGGIVSDDGSMVVTPPDGMAYDDLPTDLHRSRVIWAVWKGFDPLGTSAGVIRTVRQVMVDEFKAFQPTDNSGVRVISEGITRQTG